MKKIFAFIAVCFMSFQFATAQNVYNEEFIQEQMPQFVGGEEALSEWIENNISYPLMADVNSIEGRVVVSFDVNEDGSIGNIQVEEYADPILADEVVNRLQYMPNWIPAMQNGRNVKVTYTLPIVFRS
ncbi:MAG: energy transducer TonB [Prevotella sp.]|nr:energy transducer TonB [Prevotella sp.]